MPRDGGRDGIGMGKRGHLSSPDGHSDPAGQCFDDPAQAGCELGAAKQHLADAVRDGVLWYRADGHRQQQV